MWQVEMGTCKWQWLPAWNCWGVSGKNLMWRQGKKNLNCCLYINRQRKIHIFNLMKRSANSRWGIRARKSNISFALFSWPCWWQAEWCGMAAQQGWESTGCTLDVKMRKLLCTKRLLPHLWSVLWLLSLGIFKEWEHISSISCRKELIIPY